METLGSLPTFARSSVRNQVAEHILGFWFTFGLLFVVMFLAFCRKALERILYSTFQCLLAAMVDQGFAIHHTGQD